MSKIETSGRMLLKRVGIETVAADKHYAKTIWLGNIQIEEALLELYTRIPIWGLRGPGEPYLPYNSMKRLPREAP